MKTSLVTFLVPVLCDCTFFVTDTYEKGKQDVVSEQIMDLSEENNEKIETKDKQKDEETDADKPLLPPEVFKHLKKAETAERKEEKPVMGRKSK